MVESCQAFIRCSFSDVFRSLCFFQAAWQERDTLATVDQAVIRGLVTA
jgi:hypothetical protein